MARAAALPHPWRVVSRAGHRTNPKLGFDLQKAIGRLRLAIVAEVERRALPMAATVANAPLLGLAALGNTERPGSRLQRLAETLALLLVVEVQRSHPLARLAELEPVRQRAVTDLQTLEKTLTEYALAWRARWAGERGAAFRTSRGPDPDDERASAALAKDIAAHHARTLHEVESRSFEHPGLVDLPRPHDHLYECILPLRLFESVVATLGLLEALRPEMLWEFSEFSHSKGKVIQSTFGEALAVLRRPGPERLTARECAVLFKGDAKAAEAVDKVEKAFRKRHPDGLVVTSKRGATNRRRRTDKSGKPEEDVD